MTRGEAVAPHSPSLLLKALHTLTPGNNRQVIAIAAMSDDKGDIQHHELPAIARDDGDLDKAGVQGPLASKYATMSLKDTLKTFRLTCLYALMAAFNACNDGYCYSIPGTSDLLLSVFMTVRQGKISDGGDVGNVIAMQGFIDKFGVPGLGPDGTTALDANDLALWGALYTVGYIVVLFFGSPINDYIGRKYSMLVLQVLMIISTVMSLTAKNTDTWGAAKIFQVRPPPDA